MSAKSTILFIAALTLLKTLSAAPAPGSTGTVLASEQAGIYTYVQLDLAGEKIWYAVPTIEIKVGTAVIAPEGMLMKNFESKTLGRTFDEVYFAGGITAAESGKNPEALPAGHPPVSGAQSLPADHPPIHFRTTPSVPATIDFSSLKKLENGQTVAEIYQNAADLAGKTVSIRGIVVKSSNNIMGRNWIHLQDGTGTTGSNDLTVTSSDTAAVGATITVTGKLATDLDFGSGYTYAVLVEEAALNSK